MAGCPTGPRAELAHGCRSNFDRRKGRGRLVLGNGPERMTITLPRFEVIADRVHSRPLALSNGATPFELTRYDLTRIFLKLRDAELRVCAGRLLGCGDGGRAFEYGPERMAPLSALG